MGRLHKFATAALSLIGLLAGVLLGFYVAGVLGAITIGPVGALAGLIVGMMHFRLMELLN